jgi:hypothetical protein
MQMTWWATVAPRLHIISFGAFEKVVGAKIRQSHVLAWGRKSAQVVEVWRSGAILLSMTHEVCQPFRQPQIYLLLQVTSHDLKNSRIDGLSIQYTTRVVKHAMDTI